MLRFSPSQQAVVLRLLLLCIFTASAAAPPGSNASIHERESPDLKKAVHLLRERRGEGPLFTFKQLQELCLVW